MKTFIGAFFCLLVLFSWGGAAHALEAQQPAATAKDSAKIMANKASGGAQLMLKVPLTSPLFSQVPVVLVNDDPIYVEDVAQALGSVHKGGADEKTATGAIDYAKILDRLINVKLVTQEAVNIGLDQSPDVKDAMALNARTALAGLLMDDLSKDVKADPAEVEKRLKEMVEEWKIASVLFDKQEDAKAMSDAIKAGQPFEELAERAVADKKAKGGGKGEFMKPKDLLPDVASAVATMGTGSVSPVVKIGTGKNERFTVIKLLDKRYPETPEARAQAEQAVLAKKRYEAINESKKALLRKYVTIKERPLERLDYDSPKADLEKMRTDTHVLAEIKDGDPVTVGDLTKALAEKFYHGLEGAAKKKEVNEKKREVLNLVIERRLVKAEAARRGLDKGQEYQTMLRNINNSILFGVFVERVVVPDIKVSEEDLQAYFRDHRKEYMFPEMMKIAGLAFNKKNDAEAALAKLKKGTDFNWVRANAEGLSDTTDDVLQFDGRAVSTNTMPTALREALAGVRPGDFRLYADPSSRYYVLSILEVIPPQLQDFAQVANEVQKRVLDMKVNETLQDWFTKLRAASEIKIYLAHTSNQ